MELFCSFCFWAHRGFKSSPNSEGFILQSTICKHSVKTTKKPKGLEPCREFKSFRLFNSVSLFLKIPFSRVQILAVGKNRKMDRYFFEKKQGRKNGRNLSKSPVFSCFLVRIDFDHTTWQGQEDSNPRPTVLETGTLPAELYPCATPVLQHTSGKKARGFPKNQKTFCSVTIDVRPKAKKLQKK